MKDPLLFLVTIQFFYLATLHFVAFIYLIVFPFIYIWIPADIGEDSKIKSKDINKLKIGRIKQHPSNNKYLDLQLKYGDVLDYNEIGNKSRLWNSIDYNQRSFFEPLFIEDEYNKFSKSKFTSPYHKAEGDSDGE